MDENEFVTWTRAREVFVTKEECGSRTNELDKKVDSTNIRLAVIETKLAIIMWLLGTVAAGVIGIFIKLLFP